MVLDVIEEFQYVVLMFPTKFLVQSDIWIGRICCLKNFKMTAILSIRTEQF